MAAVMHLATNDGIVELPRIYDDNKEPLPATVWASQVVGMPPPYTGPFIPISLPYYSTLDIVRVRDAAAKLLPSWQLEIREVHVARAITHDDARALFRRWGW